MKKYKVEQDVKIKILPDKELNTDYAPPIVPDRKPNPIPEPDKKSENNTRKPRNNSCVSMVNEFLGVGGFSKVYRFKKEKDKAVKKIMSNPLIYSTKLTILDFVLLRIMVGFLLLGKMYTLMCHPNLK